MVSFIQVDPASIDDNRLGRRGRISYPLLKSFMEANIKCAKLDPMGLEGKNPTYLRSVLTSYIKNHNLPVKLFSASGETHLMRLDLDNAGNPIPNWTPEMATTEGAAGHLRDMKPVALNAAEVSARAVQEKKKSHK